jgi:hypothetical protein
MNQSQNFLKEGIWVLSLQICELFRHNAPTVTIKSVCDGCMMHDDKNKHYKYAWIQRLKIKMRAFFYEKTQKIIIVRCL